MISNNGCLIKLLNVGYAFILICYNCEYDPKHRSWNICGAMLIRARSREGKERISQPLSRVRTYYCSRIKVVQTLDSGVFLVFWSLLSYNFPLSLPPILRYGVSWTFLTELCAIRLRWTLLSAIIGPNSKSEHNWLTNKFLQTTINDKNTHAKNISPKFSFSYFFPFWVGLSQR